MVIEWSALIQTAKEIQKTLAKSPVHESFFENIIYNDAIASRKSHEELKEFYKRYWKNKEAEYAQVLRSLKFSAPSKVNLGEFQPWLYARYPIKSSRPNDIIPPKKQFIEVTYKEYFTFHGRGTAEKIWLELVNFLKGIPIIHAKLYPINQKYQDDISIKVHDTLSQLFKHTDSLVIHYKTKGLGPTIRKIVLETYHSMGVPLADRGVKAETGFDFKRMDVDPHIKKSHSELVSKILAKEIVKQQNNFRKMSTEQIAKWLQKSIEAVSRWDVKQVFHSLYITT